MAAAARYDSRRSKKMEDDAKKDSENDLVLTPGGKRPRALVRKVISGEVARFDDEGKARIVKRTREKPRKA
jgi:hypothetical protein